MATTKKRKLGKGFKGNQKKNNKHTTRKPADYYFTSRRYKEKLPQFLRLKMSDTGWLFKGKEK